MATLRWVSYSSGALPENLVVAGHRYNGEPLGIARAEIEGTLSTGKFWIAGKRAYIPYAGKEVVLSPCQVLVCDESALITWVAASGGKSATGCIVGGQDRSRDLILARGNVGQELVPGKMLPEYGKCFVSTAGKEHELTEYEVMVMTCTKAITEDSPTPLP